MRLNVVFPPFPPSTPTLSVPSLPTTLTIVIHRGKVKRLDKVYRHEASAAGLTLLALVAHVLYGRAEEAREEKTKSQLSVPFGRH